MIFLQFIEVLVSFKYVVYIQTRTWMFHVINQCCQIPVSKYKSELKTMLMGLKGLIVITAISCHQIDQYMLVITVFL